jgi:hypothetical protein
MTNTLQISPEIAKLQTEVTTLEKELGKVILEQDEMVNAIKPNLEAEYQKTIGYKELECLENEIASRRLKRQIELLQAAINRQEEIDPEKVEQQLDDEFQEWYEKVETHYNKLKEAQDRIEGLMSDEDSAEFKKLYRQLVFKLHPDLNPNQSKDEINLWHRVQLAYQGGDLEEIRSLIIILESQDKTAELPSSGDILEKRKKGLTEQIQKIIGRLSDMKKEFPFNIAKNLADKDWVRTKLEEIDQKICHFEDKCREYNELLKVLLVSKETGVN